MLFLLPATIFTVAIFLAPLGAVVMRSFFDQGFSFDKYHEVLGSKLFYKVLWNTIVISVTATCVTLVLAYPMAYHLARQPARRRTLYMIMIMLPFWTSILVKSYAFMIILGQNGIINSVLGMADIPKVTLIYNRVGVIIGMVHFLIPFVLFPIFTSLLQQNPNLRNAADTMGAGRWRIFFRITLPLSMPGVLAGSLLAMIQSLGFFITAALLGGRGDLMIANLIDFYTREVLDWGTASAVAVLLLLLTGSVLLVLGRFAGGMGRMGKTL
ncbi:ABC transporter permease [Rhodobacteraceae bacterium LMO-12]|nr:ABC transporter permease [Rhodobacteraceae bacterium LMO-JJ12]